jgi:hypothetical protein
VPYAILSEVKDAAPQLFNTTTAAVPDSRVNAAIAIIDSQINAKLAAIGYTLPIDAAASPQAWAILKDIEVHGVIARLINTRAFGIDDPTKFGSRTAQAYYDDKLDRLADADDPFRLPDAPQGPQQATESYASSAIGGNTVNDPRDIATRIERDTVF